MTWQVHASGESMGNDPGGLVHLRVERDTQYGERGNGSLHLQVLSLFSHLLFSFSLLLSALLCSLSHSHHFIASHPLTLFFFLLCMCHGVGEYVHQCLKVKPLTASIQFIPVWNQLE